MNNSPNSLTPAQQLIGKELPNDWKVEKLIDRPETATGGHFSTSYIVRSGSGVKAFLKAMDFKKALESPDPARMLQIMTAAYNFERDILEKCKSNHLSRIVRVLDSGRLPPQTGDPSSVVQYLIFELADADIRSFVNWGKSFDITWALRTIHHAAAALQQLHSAEIAHQDVKPSNVLIFNDQHSKLADLGRAFDSHSTSPHDEFEYAGDPSYAPPELLYRYIPEDWRVRRFGCDVYLLGSLVIFFFAGVSMTHLLFNRLDRNHNCKHWGGSYSEVLPYLQHVFAQIVQEIRADFVHKTAELVKQEKIRTNFANEIAELIKQLCNPDPQLRGHPKNVKYKNSNQYSLIRYVSIFDRLAKQAEYSLRFADPIRKSN